MFYGWIMVAVAFVTQFISSGIIFYTFGIALKEWTVEFDAGRLGVSGIHFVLPWAGAAIAPFVGRLASAGHLRVLIPAGAVAAGLGFCAISQATSLWQLYVVYPLLMAYAAGTLSGVGASTLVVNWFSRTRATALGISQIGASVGGMIMAPLTVSLFGAHGWRDVYLGFGLVILAIAPLLAWLIVGRPADRGLHPDGVAAPAPSASPGASAPLAPQPAFRTRAALRETNIWLIAFITGVGFMLSSVVVTHLVAMATDAGVEPLRASRLLAIMATVAAFGKIAFGRLADRAGERTAYAVSIVLEVVALGGILLLPTSLALEGITAILGLGIGGNLPLSAALVARTFGSAAFGPMMGMKTMLMTPLVATGTPFAGWIFDETGSYRIAFSVFLALVVLSLAALWRVRPAVVQP
ncbi:MAG: MFS transporter [Deltaproteobacteria bacterium]|nr:MFS transporter [Deltaproteobacteria bacterium]